MLRFVPLVLLAACAADVVLAAPQTTTPDICDGYLWGVIIVQVLGPPNTVYNRQRTSLPFLEQSY